MKNKKIKKAGNEGIRKGWQISPVTRVKESKKKYRRNKKVDHD